MSEKCKEQIKKLLTTNSQKYEKRKSIALDTYILNSIVYIVKQMLDQKMEFQIAESLKFSSLFSDIDIFVKFRDSKDSNAWNYYFIDAQFRNAREFKIIDKKLSILFDIFIKSKESIQNNSLKFIMLTNADISTKQDYLLNIPNIVLFDNGNCNCYHLNNTSELIDCLKLKQNSTDQDVEAFLESFFVVTNKNELISSQNNLKFSIYNWMERSNGLYLTDENCNSFLDESTRRKITFDENDIISAGSSGTMVFRGKFNNITVAVKRLTKKYYDLAINEIKILEHSFEDKQHENLIRYFFCEEKGAYINIALEKCELSLNDFVDRNNKDKIDSKLLDNILKQSAEGLRYLHEIDIVHRDVKPHNYLIKYGTNSEMRVLISDFGISKKISKDSDQFTNTKPGTTGWTAPELLNKNGELSYSHATTKIDVFSLGCVFYFVLSLGYHPFDPQFFRQQNILKNDFNLDELNEEDKIMHLELIKRMISKDPNQRPTMEEVSKYPIFWDSKTISGFFQEVSDHLKALRDSDLNHPILQAIEKHSIEILNTNWLEKIDENLKKELEKRRHDGTSVISLLRAFRNIKHHYKESLVYREIFNRDDDQMVSYFTSRFPKLLLHVFETMKTLSNEPQFQIFY